MIYYATFLFLKLKVFPCSWLNRMRTLLKMCRIEYSDLPLVFSSAGILFKSFSLISVFNQIFSFLVHHSLILKIASTILNNIPFIFNVINDRDSTKSCTQHLQIHSLDSNGKNFSCFDYF
jgi:hypothetical protein